LSISALTATPFPFTVQPLDCSKSSSGKVHHYKLTQAACLILITTPPPSTLLQDTKAMAPCLDKNIALVLCDKEEQWVIQPYSAKHLKSSEQQLCYQP